ncbi:MAG TPA: HAMP domain-containing sensor histidine kinase [Herpetosiphonaceae bacterium]
MRRRSLKTRLTLSHVLVTLGGLILLGVALIVLVQRGQRADMISNLTAQAQVYAVYASELATDSNTLAVVAPTLVQRFNPPPDTTVRVLAPNGAVLFASRDLGNFPSRAAVPLLTSPLPIQPFALEHNRRFVAYPVVRDAQTIGVVELSQTVVRDRALLGLLLLALIPSAAFALAVAGVAGHLLARSLVRPLSDLRRVATTIAGGDTTARSTDRSDDEIGQLAARLNTMADELQTRLAEVERLANARQEFYRAISHELRTPLTAIRGTAENLEDDASPEQQADLQIIQTEAARLQRLVDELLQPRDSTPAPLRRRQPIDLSELIAEAGRIMQPRAERAGVLLTATSEPGLSILGDRDRLKQALLNLLDNALTWTPPGGSVALSACTDRSDTRIEVRDSGPGIAPELREQVWQRGFSTTNGQGQGLALVREVVTAHHGTAIIQDQLPNRIELRLPLLIENKRTKEQRAEKNQEPRT